VSSQHYDSLRELSGVPAVLESFTRATGFQARLLPIDDSDGAPPVELAAAGSLCRLFLNGEPGGKACQQFIRRLRARARVATEPICAQCFARMKEMAAPVRAHGEPCALLVCGPALANPPRAHEFGRLLARLERMGIVPERQRAWRAYCKSPFATRTELRCLGRLLSILAEHLGAGLERWIDRAPEVKRDCVSRGCQFAQEHLEGVATSRAAAAAAAVCPQYFCRRFKATTGSTFTEYVRRCRVEKAKRLLADRTTRISEIAFACGFQSLPYFDRTFKLFAGLSPKAYRARVVRIRRSAS
jgi:AraC-like DNA-binding protein